MAQARAEFDDHVRDVSPERPFGRPLLVGGGAGLFRQESWLDAHADTDTEDGLSAGVRWRCQWRLSGEGGGLLKTLVGQLVDSEPFDIALRWHSVHGFSAGGSGTVRLTVPLRARTPLVTLDALEIVGTLPSGPGREVTVGIGASVSARFGSVLTLGVRGVGVKLSWTPPAEGAPPLGALRIEPRPPDGGHAALAVPGVLEGGGALRADEAAGQYDGALQMRLLGIGVTATGIVSTKPSFSFFATLAADFRPVGLDLGLGFTLNAVGGIVGLNRGMDLAALGDAVRCNALTSLMFPADPVRNASRIVADLSRFFPPAPGRFVVGPMLELGWGKPTGMVALALGLIVEVPDPKIAVIGRLRVLVPPVGDAAVLRLQVNFVGSLDVGARFLRFDASLVDSRLALFTLEGDLIVRLRWGSGAGFALAVGGFHPAWRDSGGLDIPASLRRVSISLLAGSFPRVRLDAYFAVTSNTVQAGARLEVAAMVGDFGIRGWLGFDALAQFAPRLRLILDVGGQVEAIAFGETIFSIGFSLHIDGPSPWNVAGEASFKVLLVPARIPVRFTIGSAEAPEVPPIPLHHVLIEQLELARNWRARLPPWGAAGVRLADVPVDDNTVLAHPHAGLSFEQHAVPLGVRVDRFGGALADKPTVFTIEQMLLVGGEPLADDPSHATHAEFAVAQFQGIDDASRLSRPSFEPFRNGLAAPAARLAAAGRAKARVVRHDEWVVDDLALGAKRSRLLRLVAGVTLMDDAMHSLRGAAAGRHAWAADRMRALPEPDRQFAPATEAFVVVDSRTLETVGTPQGSHAEALAALGGADHRLAPHLTVMSVADLATA